MLRIHSFIIDTIRFTAPIADHIARKDRDLANQYRRALSSVALPHREMGRRAVELLLDLGCPATVERVPMPLVTRASLARA